MQMPLLFSNLLTHEQRAFADIEAIYLLSDSVTSSHIDCHRHFATRYLLLEVFESSRRWLYFGGSGVCQCTWVGKVWRVYTTGFISPYNLRVASHWDGVDWAHVLGSRPAYLFGAWRFSSVDFVLVPGGTIWMWGVWGCMWREKTGRTEGSLTYVLLRRQGLV